MLSQAYKSRVFRPQWWITAVILINGSIQGVWQYIAQRLQTVVKVQLFTSPTGRIRKEIEAEVERLAGFFKKNVLVEYEDW